FPPELQSYNLYTAGVGTAAEQPEAAKALIKFLTSPAAAAVIKAKGMEPVTP
ncbi:MAG: substrate-binding domain-containing protein, partial [Deltaproteobacteria bacterium]|nr:substrate-binding domain-containing protein [Deltaproteobacteria bacterium]